MRSIRSPRSSDSSRTNTTLGAKRSLRFRNNARRKNPAAALSALMDTCRAAGSARTLTCTLTLFKSGLTVAPVMVAKPMRGSRTSRRSSFEISPLMRSETRSVRVLKVSPGGGPHGAHAVSGEELEVAAQDLSRELALDLALDRRKGVRN